MAAFPSFVGTIKSPSVSLNSTTSTSLHSAGVNGAGIFEIWTFASSTFSGGNLEIYHNNGTSDIQIGAVALTAGQGLNICDGSILPAELRIESGDSLKVKLASYSAGSVSVMITKGGDY